MLHSLRRSPQQLLRVTRRSTRLFTNSPFAAAAKEVNLRIVFGSQSGTAEAFAYEMDFDAQEANIKTEVVDALNFSIKDLAATSPVVTAAKDRIDATAFIVACYGEGEPTDNAKKFFRSVEEASAAHTPLNAARYSVFGLGNSQCFRDRYNVVGKGLDMNLKELGGERLVSLGLGDASPALTGDETMGERFGAWKRELIAKLQVLANSEDDGPSAAAGSSTSSPSISPSDASPSPNAASATLTESATDAPCPIAAALAVKNASETIKKPLFEVPIALSARQLAMVPSHRQLLLSGVSHVTQLFAKTDEVTAAVEVEFDLTRTQPLSFSSSSIANESDSNAFTKGLQPGDHVGVFAPNSKHVVARFALAAGLSEEELDQPFDPSPSSSSTNSATLPTLRQVLTWQVHLSGVASITSIKLLQRWLSSPSIAPLLPQTAQLFAELETKYESLVKEKGLDSAAVLDMIPKVPLHSPCSTAPSPALPAMPEPVKLPVSALVKTLPTLNPRLYSITHMVLPEDQEISHESLLICPHTSLPLSSPTASDDFTKVTLLCRLLRYRQTKSSANRVVDGVCSSFLTERLRPQSSVGDDEDNGGINSKVAIFFRESNFHLPPMPSLTSTTAPSIVMISGGSGLAPIMSFLEERLRRRTRLVKEHERSDGNSISTVDRLGKAVLYFGCRTVDEYIFRDKLISYLGDNTANHPVGPVLDRLVVSASSSSVSTAVLQSLHEHEVVMDKPQHIPSVFLQDKEYLLPLLRDTEAMIYVCGGAGQFGKAVREAVNTIAVEAFDLHDANKQDGMHPGIRYLIDKKRYFEDLAD